MIRVADLIIKKLKQAGIKDAFLVTGGGAMHLNDALACEPEIKKTCSHHEQASAFGAEAYARIHGGPALLNVTTGPGGINALNGVFGAWTDSIPMIVVSGQVKRETMMASYPELKIRQLGDQEVDIVKMVEPITKYSATLFDPQLTLQEIEKCIYLASEGRPGPVWLDVPVDVQGMMIDETTMKAFSPPIKKGISDALTTQVAALVERLQRSERPVFLVGNGIRLSATDRQFLAIADKLQIPVCTAWAQDFILTENPLFCGIQGTVGDRAGNFVVQNSDLTMILGTRLPIRQISYNYKSFARNAFKVHVDVDSGELNKPLLKCDLAICADLKDFFPEFEKQISALTGSKWDQWLSWSQARKQKYNPVVEARHRQSRAGFTNPYHFFEEFFRHLPKNAITVAGDGAASVMAFPAAKISGTQRLFTNTGSASMGYDLPAAIGAAIAAPNAPVFCIAGDGSIQMNIQELQTVVHHKLNLKVIILNNGGYLSIRSTQKSFFQGRMLGESAASGVSFPDPLKLAEAYGIPAIRIQGSDFTAQLKEFINTPGFGLLEAMVDPDQIFEPKLSSRRLEDGSMVSSPLEDLAPFLPRDEFKQNMLVPLDDSSK